MCTSTNLHKDLAASADNFCRRVRPGGSRNGEHLSGIRTNAAAELLGVSPNTLRSWERRFGYPRPRRTQGGHRQYDLAERSVERTVEEVLLPGLALVESRESREAERELALRWATGWLYASRRVAPPASRPQGVLLFDSSPRLDLESLNVQALELALRRAGFRTLLLAFDLPPERVVRAVRAVDPTAFLFCGGEATLDVVGRLVYTVRQVGSVAPVFEYREAMAVSGDHGIPSLGSAPVEAVERLKAYVDSGRIEQVVVVPEAGEGQNPPPFARRAVIPPAAA